MSTAELDPWEGVSAADRNLFQAIADHAASDCWECEQAIRAVSRGAPLGSTETQGCPVGEGLKDRFAEAVARG